jgi:outer membrane immunogenic protein
MIIRALGAMRALPLTLTITALSVCGLTIEPAAAGKMKQHQIMSDVPPPPLEMPIAAGHNWAGLYVGGFLGGVHALWIDDFYRNQNHGHAELPIDGIAGGGWVGYNMYVSPHWVAGVEADLGLSNASEVTEVFDNDTTYASVNHFGSLRGRLGYAMDNVLLYGTAGLAFANLTEDLQKGRNPGEQLVRDNMYHWGYALGGGAEYAFSDRWIGRMEYLYSHFSQDSFRNAQEQLAEFNNSLHQVRVGMSYKF